MTPKSKTLLIVVSADKGLCGSFNTNIIKAAGGFITETTEPVTLGLVGRKGRDFFGRRGFEVLMEQVGIFQKLRYEDAQGIDEWQRAGLLGEGIGIEGVRLDVFVVELQRLRGA